MAGLHELAGRIAVVTGGASGIGKAIARRLVAERMTVVIADIEQAALDGAAAQTGATGIRVDVGSAASMQALADEVARRFGGVDLFCGNAGVASTAKIADMAAADWEWLFGVNVWGFIHGVKAFLPLLRARPDGGWLAVTASMSALHVTPGIGGYTVSKFAVTALAETLAVELREEGADVGVTILCPGPVSTRLGSAHRNRPAALSGGAMVDSDLEATEEGGKLRWIAPDAVARTLVEAVRRGDLHAFTHPEMAPLVEERHRRILDALAAAAAREG